MNFVRVEGYANYVIHPCGTILRIWKNKTKEMKTRKEKNGYMRIELSNNGKGKKFLVHRLLALHFIPNPENKPTVDHKNRIRDDNRLENLQWATLKEQMENASRRQPADFSYGGRITKDPRCNSWQWTYLIKGKRFRKNMKSKQSLEKYRDEIIKKYLIS